MPRSSKKELALAAALRIIEADGVGAVTYDSLAKETGLSKSGLIYHFPSRHALLTECHRFCAARWEADLEAMAGGKKAEQLLPRERLRALLLSLAKTDPLIELLMSIHSQQHPDYAAPWHEVDNRWMPDASADAAADGADFARLVLTVLGTGLWVHDHITDRKLSPANRRLLIDKMLAYLDSEGREPLL